MPDFDDSLPVQISMVGEGTEEEDGDGYVNYIYRVQTPKESLVLKQGTEISRVSQQKIATYRNRLEYNSMRIFYAITPEYVPYLKFQDRENNIFVMEDVSDLKVVRFQLNKNKMFRNLAVSVANLWQRQNFAHQNIICPVNSIVDCKSILKILSFERLWKIRCF